MLDNLNYNLQTLRGDVFGGITSAVVGLPVALAFGSAAGLSSLAGIYGAIAVGFFTAIFRGTRSQISGSTSSMTVAMAVIVSTHADNLAAAFTIVIMAGFIQIFLGLLRIGRFVAYTLYSVISGFMTCVGIIIILARTRPFIGAQVVSGGPVGAIRHLPELFSQFDSGALSIAAVRWPLLFYGPKSSPNISPPHWRHWSSGYYWECCGSPTPLPLGPYPPTCRPSNGPISLGAPCRGPSSQLWSLPWWVPSTPCSRPL